MLALWFLELSQVEKELFTKGFKMKDCVAARRSESQQSYGKVALSLSLIKSQKQNMNTRKNTHSN